MNVKSKSQLYHLIMHHSACCSLIGMILIIAALMSFPVSNVCSQDRQRLTLDQFKDSVSMYFGTPDELVSGQPHFPEHPGAKGFSYFNSDNWADGVIYAGDKVYKEVEIKYDIVLQRVLLLASLRNGARIPLLVKPSLVDSFSIEGRRFVPEKYVSNQPGAQGFIYIVHGSTYSLVKSYQKNFVASFNSQTPNGFYSKQSERTFIAYRGELVKIKGNKGIPGYFKPYKKKINLFLKQNHIRLKSASSEQLVECMKFCNQLAKESQ